MRVKIRYQTSFWEVKIRFLGAPQKEDYSSSQRLSEPIDPLVPLLRGDPQVTELENDLPATASVGAGWLHLEHAYGSVSFPSSTIRVIRCWFSGAACARRPLPESFKSFAIIFTPPTPDV